ncbi:MAG: hypothetical protein U0V18_04855 [Anaerolineales bacterium]
MKKVWIGILLGVVLAGCSTNVPPEMRARMIDTENVPSEWIIFNESKGEDWGGQLYTVAFAYGNESESPALEQQLIVYSDESAAITGYDEFDKYIFVEEWTLNSEITFAPSTATDKFSAKCTDREIDHVMTKICFVLQQHANYVSALGVHMGGPITFDVLNSVLKSIDAKLNQ